MDKQIKHKYGQNDSDKNSSAGNPSVTQNPTNDGTLPERNDKLKENDESEEDTKIQENKSSKEQKNRVQK